MNWSRHRPAQGRLVAAVLALAAVAASAAPAPAPEPASAPALTDSPGGMTCDFWATIGTLRWQRRGGDWDDAAGQPFGERPFATTALPAAGAVPAAFHVDARPLVAAWEQGKGVHGGVFVRLLGRGFADIATREHASEAARPRLSLAWDDGLREQLAPSADTYTTCSTYRSVGDRPTMQVSDGQALLLVFPFKPRPGHRLVQARLEMTALRISTGSALGLFALRTPASEDRPVQQGLAAAYRSDAGIERDPQVLFAERFDRPGWASSWQVGSVGGEAVAADPGNRFVPLDGKALRAALVPERNLGLDLRLQFKQRLGSEPEEAFLRYYLRFGDDWEASVDGGKLPGLSGTYDRAGWGGRPADGMGGWSARGAFFRQARAGDPLAPLQGIGSYLYHMEAEGGYGEAVGWNLGPTGMLARNRWYCIEQQVRLNRPGERDGVFRAWVDGRLAYERTDLRFRAVPELRIENAWLNVYHGGTARPARRMTLYIDNVVIARRYIGPLGAAR